MRTRFLKHFSFFFLCIVLLCGCKTTIHQTPSYQQQYSHLSLLRSCSDQMTRDPYMMVIYVRAPRLDYTSFINLCSSTRVHPVDGSQNGDVGHAWVHLLGEQNGCKVDLEGGHTGDFGHTTPRYAVEIRKLIEQRDPNPIRCIWVTKDDGMFQPGCGGHQATFAAKYSLSKEQFDLAVQAMVDYDYQPYRLPDRQCTTFAAYVAAAAGLQLEHSLTIDIEQEIRLFGCRVALWSDPRYKQLTLSTPDILERSLIHSVVEGQAWGEPNRPN